MVGTKLLLLNLSFVVVIALGQDTLPQETHVSSKNKPPASYSDNSSRLLEERFSRRLRETERRLIHRFEDKFRALNQSIAIEHLENFVHHFTEEIESAKDAELEQNDVIRQLKAQNTHKSHELRRLRTSLERLRSTVGSLNDLVEELVQRKNKETYDRTESPTESASVSSKTTYVPFKPLFPTDCQYVYESGGMKYPGYYYIMIQPDNSPDPFKVCCKMTNNSGWTLVQRRQDGAVDFFRNWDDYKKGFGNLEGEFWLGNDRLYQLTSQGDYKLRIEMTDWSGRNYWAEYEHFRVDSEDRNYRLHVHGYSGDAGDSLTSKWQGHDNMPFSTRDHDNDERFYDNCAEHYHGAWWFRSCFDSHLNGIYYQKGSHNNYFVRNGVQWNTIHLHSSLKFVAMMVKPNPGAHDNDNIPNGIK